MKKLLLKQGKPCNRNIKKMEPIQGNPCSLNRFSPCNVCFCFDFHDFFSFSMVQWTGISLCILQLFHVPTTVLEGLLWYPVIFTESLQGRITTQGDPCNLYREGVCSVVFIVLGMYNFEDNAGFQFPLRGLLDPASSSINDVLASSSSDQRKFQTQKFLRLIRRGRDFYQIWKKLDALNYFCLPYHK